MDLGLNGRTALVCASSSGLGKACALSLAREGCAVIMNGRDAERLAAAVREIVELTGARVRGVCADLNREEGRRALLEEYRAPDILVTNNAGPPPGELSDWDRDMWLAALEANLLAPVLLIRAVLPGMRARRFGRIVNIISAMVKSPRAHMGLSAASRAGLTALAKAVSHEAVVDNVTLNNLLPERFDTGRQQQLARRIAAEEGIDHHEARSRIVATVAAGRFGLPHEFGDACAYLCSAQAGYICGQNLQLDGGTYPGLI